MVYSYNNKITVKFLTNSLPTKVIKFQTKYFRETVNCLPNLEEFFLFQNPKFILPSRKTAFKAASAISINVFVIAQNFIPNFVYNFLLSFLRTKIVLEYMESIEGYFGDIFSLIGQKDENIFFFREWKVGMVYQYRYEMLINKIQNF